MKQDFPSLALLSLSTALFFFFGLRQNFLYYDSNVFFAFFLMVAFIFAAPYSSLVDAKKFRGYQFYLILTTLLVYVAITILTARYLEIAPLSLISSLILLRIFVKKFGKATSVVSKSIAFSAIFGFMMFLSGLVRISYASPGYAMAFASIYDDSPSIGVPFFFSGGVVVFTDFFTITLSIASFLLYAFLSALLTENYSLIFRFLKGRKNAIAGSTISGAMTAISCQCESLAATFPTFVVLLLSAFIVPLIAESIIFVMLTNLFLLIYYFKGKNVKLIDRLWRIGSNRLYVVLMAITILLTPFLEIYGIFFSLESNLIFFGGINILMYISGVFTALIMTKLFPSIAVKKKFALFFLVLASTIAMYAWYIPIVTFYAYYSPSLFALMGIFSIMSGVATGVVYKSVDTHNQKLYLEYLTMMFSMLAIIIFYLSAVARIIIWPEFGFFQQLTFSLLLWAISLPIMWLSTNITLNSYVIKIPA